MMKSTRTFAILEVSKETYEEIAEKLRAAGYNHVFLPSHDTIGIDMNGICLQVTREALAEKAEPGLACVKHRGTCACGKTSEWACADCKIDTGDTIYVCGTRACRVAHEKSCMRPRPDFDSRQVPSRWARK